MPEIAHSDPTRRFSSRVADYVRFRPSYPPELIALLERECGLTTASTIADIGSGTGLLAEMLLRFGATVWGVEPNPEMRGTGEKLLARFDRFRSVDGRAEATPLETASIDLITAGQAFHWFEAMAARAEFRRILKRHGWVILAWNERLTGPDPFLKGYEALLDRYAPDYARVDYRRIDRAALEQFFGHDKWGTASFPNSQRFDWEGVAGRLRSSSYAPQPGSAIYAETMASLETLYRECQRDGFVEFLYETKIYFGRLPECLLEPGRNDRSAII